MKVVIYTRVSTDEQKENGFSLQDQERRLRLECSRKGYTIIEHYQDDHSAKNFQRPEFQRFYLALKDRKIKPAKFLCVRMDRFTRNMVEGFLMVKEFKDYGVEFETLENHIDLESPESLIPFALNMLLPEVDNKRKALNTIAGMRQAVREGRFVWRAPLGYSNNVFEKSIDINPKTAPLVQFAFKTYSEGNHSVDQIRGLLKQKGLLVGKQTLCNMLRNPFYIGKIVLKPYKNEPEETFIGKHEPLIEEHIFKTCQDIINGKKKKLSKPETRKENLPLRGFLRCAKCGGKLTGSNSRSRNGQLHSYYHCQNGCKERFRADEANELFIAFLKEFEIDERTQQLYCKVLTDVFKANDTDRQKHKKALEAQIEALQMRIDTLNDKYIDGLIDNLTYKQTKERYEQSKTELISSHMRLQPEGAALNSYLNFSIGFIKDLGCFYKKADLEGKQQIIGSIFPDNLVFEEKKYRTTKVNEVIRLISSIDKGFEGMQIKKAGKIADLSSLAPPVGLEPTTL